MPWVSDDFEAAVTEAVARGVITAPQPDYYATFTPTEQEAMHLNLVATLALMNQTGVERIDVPWRPGLWTPTPQPAPPPVKPPAAYDRVINPGDPLVVAADATVLITAGTYRRAVLYAENGATIHVEPGTVFDGEGATSKWFDPPQGRKNVTVTGSFTVTNYLASSQRCVVDLRGTDTIRFVGISHDQPILIRNARYGGFEIGSNGYARFVHVTEAGQIGFKGDDAVDALLEDCKALRNHWDSSISSGFEAGGSKFVRTTRLTLRRCEAANNDGPGWWTDIDNFDTRYLDCTAYDNTERGLFHEISGPCLVDGGEYLRNGDESPWLYNADILIAHSGTHTSTTLPHNGCEVRNVHAGNICGIQQDRSSPGPAACKLKGLWVHHNVIDLTDPHGVASPDSDGLAPFTPAWNNRFDFNEYRGRGLDEAIFEWNNGRRTWRQWQSAGNDSHSVLA